MTKIQDFLYVNSNWQDQYKRSSDARYDSFKTALNLLMQIPRDIHILETGCQRMVDDWGAGCSTKLFMHFLRQHWYVYESCQHQLVSIDNSLPNLRLSYEVVENYIEPPHVSFQPILSDSLEAMHRILDGKTTKEELQAHELAHKLGDEIASTKFDLIYLDSRDANLDDKEDNDLAQQHQLKEAELAVQMFKSENLIDGHPFILLLDDNNLPFGGKTRLTKEYLLDIGWILLYDWQQSLWVKF